ncbi:MAG: C10 family peptidase [Bacteroidales bacterium]|nr:C10 family peptidase [Bacteroidales bacterium]
MAAACTLAANAEQLTPEQALARMGQSAPAKAKAADASQMRLAKTLTAEGINTLYVFNGQDRAMILSADDCAQPLLGYTEGVIDADNLPSNMQRWLDDYSRQIAYAAKLGIQNTEVEEEPWEPVGPLCSTLWSQEGPYNLLCPEKDGELCLTGCVATAMAQVMKYHEWPVQGRGTVAYTWERHADDWVNLEMDMSEAVFDWDNMLNTYDNTATEEQQLAVATLMKACGYAVEMYYGGFDEGSGALSEIEAYAMREYLDYAPSASLEMRNHYSFSQWEEMLYDNLREYGPISFGGVGTDWSGHAFVCDGYQDGYFHFNWGWGGSMNGFFQLDAIGIDVGAESGGESQVWDFCYYQSVVLGLAPSTKDVEAAKPYMYSNDPLALAEDSDNPSWIWLMNPVFAMANRILPYEMGMHLINVDNSAEDIYLPFYDMGIYLIEPCEFMPGYGYGDLVCHMDGLEPGSYLVNPVSREVGDNEWVPIRFRYPASQAIEVEWDGAKVTVKDKNNVIPDDAYSFFDIGKAIFEDPFVYPAYTSEWVASWEVDIQEANELPGLYRLVNPYANYPLIGQTISLSDIWGEGTYTITYDDSTPHYIYIHAENPDCVYMTTSYTGLTIDPEYGEMIGTSYLWENCLKEGATEDLADAIAKGMAGYLEDGMITFPQWSLMDREVKDDEWRYTTQIRDTKIVLPGTPDCRIHLATEGCGAENRIPCSTEIGSDVAAVLYYTMPGAADLSQAVVKETYANHKEDCIELSESEEFTVELPTSGKYTLFVFALDADGNYRGGDVKYLYGVDYSTEGWTELGQVDFTEVFVSQWYKYDNEIVPGVTIEGNNATPGFYRLVNPYSTHSLSQYLHADDHDHYIYIHAEDPERVYIDECPVGLDCGYGQTFVWSLAGQQMENGMSADEVAAANSFGKMEDSVITFPEGSLLMFDYCVMREPRLADALSFSLNLSGLSGLSGVAADECETPVQYFNLQGQRIANPTPGLYIKVTGSHAEKLRIK